MNKLGLYIFLFLCTISALAFIFFSLRNDQRERELLNKHKIIERYHEINAKIRIDNTIKGYIYITLRDGRQFIIGPTKKLTTENKIFGYLASGDSLIKYSMRDTIYIVKQNKNSEKFLLLY
ncbi:MAG TPA: hypothetical protein PKM03_01835 [Cyclobacteriaceae bacterium]|nr:hypothetical protein [Cyclobacteriaceae bacterium]